jgi:hypothetical protein
MQDAGINLIYQMEDKNGIIVEMILGWISYSVLMQNRKCYNFKKQL